MRLGLWVLAAGCGFVPAHAWTQSRLQYSADVSLDLAGVGHDHDYFDGVPAATARIALPGLPHQVDLDALEIEPDFAALISLDVAATVGDISAAPGDVLRYRHGVYSLEFDASTHGVPDGVDCDAVARDPDGRLLLSFDRTFTANGLTIYRADVVALDASGFVKVVESGGIANGLDVDALHSESATVLLVSFDTGGTLGGVVFADEDVLALDLVTLAWSLRHDFSALSSRWGPADLDALSAAAVGDGLFVDGFE